MTHVAQVTCPHDCPDSCLIEVTVFEGRATRVAASKEHPFTRGALCAKVNKLLDRVYAPTAYSTRSGGSDRKGLGRGSSAFPGTRRPPRLRRR